MQKIIGLERLHSKIIVQSCVQPLPASFRCSGVTHACIIILLKTVVPMIFRPISPFIKMIFWTCVMVD